MTKIIFNYRENRFTCTVVYTCFYSQYNIFLFIFKNSFVKCKIYKLQFFLKIHRKMYLFYLYCRPYILYNVNIIANHYIVFIINFAHIVFLNFLNVITCIYVFILHYNM